MLLPEADAVYQNGTRNGAEIASYDHLFPRALGGQGGLNLVIAHRGCNSKRGHNLPTEGDVERLHTLNMQRKHLFHHQTWSDRLGSCTDRMQPTARSTTKEFVANVVHNIVNNRLGLRKLPKTLTVDT